MPDDPFDIPLFRPRMGRRADAERSFRNQLKDVLRAFRVGRSPSRPPGKEPGAATNQRRVVVKAHVVQMKGKALAACAKHLAYLERDGVAEDAGRGVLFDAHGDVERSEFAGPRDGEKVQFRFIISPEDGAELDMRAYVRRVMAKMEKDLCRPLEWGAVVHHDNGHPHAHVIVRGVDRNGNAVRIPREYMARGLREQAQEIATQDLGPRTRDDLARQRAREVTQERFTTLDRELVGRARKGEVTVDGRGARDAQLTARLHHLASLHLAERVSRHAWRLDPSLDVTLRKMGDRGDILRTMHATLKGDPAKYEVASADGVDLRSDTVARLVRKVVTDELRGGLSGIFETASGRAIAMPLSGKSGEELREGDVVMLRPGKDPTLGADEKRGARGGPVREEAVPPRGPAGAEGSRRTRRRGRRDDELEDLFGGAPSRARRVTVEPIRPSQERGAPDAWLDALDETAWSKTGFGAELRRAKEARRSVVAEKGQRDEMRVERIVRATRLAHAPLSDVPFRGRLLREGNGPDAVFYVTDGRRFAVVPSAMVDARLVGRTVSVRAESDGRVRVQTPERER